MQALLKMSDRLTFSVEANTQKELFEKVAEVDTFAEVFGIQQCGCCKNKNIKFQVRLAEDKKKKGKYFKFYELLCSNFKCRAKFSFGQLQEGDRLFPKRKDENGEYLPNDGWVKFKKEETETPESE